jgi:hypothetical protein
MSILGLLAQRRPCAKNPERAWEDGGMGDMRRSRPEPPRGIPRIEHRPGMADELMREIAPLLAEEGIDIYGEGAPDVATLQAALDRAVERRNNELFTPTGARRDLAVEAVRAAVRAILSGDGVGAARCLDAVQPESPDNSVATVSSCIGLALNRLDETLSEGDGPPVALPAGHWSGERAAIDVLALARKGKAFRSLRQLIVRQGGPQLLYGSAVAVAAAVAAISKRTGQPADEVIEDVVR